MSGSVASTEGAREPDRGTRYELCFTVGDHASVRGELRLDHVPGFAPRVQSLGGVLLVDWVKEP